ncbi:MAG TPA: tetratricopeptide repeat protein [Phycisphaerae bacterium]|nr:tetratricopeptide repeat protein [Phycisphaerae bacterium]HRW51289.1 tetratricopeptide repeat protein [Phycisphaerae bacterium]
MTRIKSLTLLFVLPMACANSGATVQSNETSIRTGFPSDSHLADAYDSFNQNRYAQAIYTCDSAIIRNENDAEAYMLRGAAYCVCDEIYNGIESVAAAFRLNPAYQNHDAPVDRAHEHYLDAVVKLDTTSILKPRYADAFVTRALERQRAGDLDNALQCCDEAIALVGDKARSYSARGNILLEQGAVDRAIADFRQAAALQPSCASTHAATLQRYAGAQRSQGDGAIVEKCNAAAQGLLGR